ncbi:MAG: HEPN domain-containing protein [Nanoarchaeota archaeon]|nr:HEPN domain-containing protein [Nanoarchaeota archaeon]
MSHAGNKMKWCLKKAEKEKGKHRGLVMAEPDMEEAKRHLKKAEHNLLAISYFSDGGFSDWSMSAAFYCIYHCFLAIAARFGYESKNQECTIALINHLKQEGKIEFDEKFIAALGLLDETGRHETNIIEEREEYTYGTSISVRNKKEIGKNIALCKECLNDTKAVVLR